MGKRRNAGKVKREERKRKYHDKLVTELFEDPSLLNIEKLNPDTIIDKFIEPSRHDRDTSISDLMFIYRISDNEIEILGLDIKSTGTGGGIKRGDRQLYAARGYMGMCWKDALRNLDISERGIYWLDLFEVYRDLGEIKMVKPVRYDIRRTMLGEYPSPGSAS